MTDEQTRQPPSRPPDERTGREPSFAAVREIFLAVEALAMPERDRSLEALCGSDGRLREKVLRMLDGPIRDSMRDSIRDSNRDSIRDSGWDSGWDSGFLGSPAMLDGEPFLAAEPPIPEAIGPYRIEGELGEGGFGTVYRARQERPIRREVAIKVIKPGMDTRAVVARFEAERQTLALLQHPNIAQVFDAGSTAEGRPYFVMELIDGERITQHCDDRALSIDDRLAIFIEVCRAVEYAHQRGVIHRDLKPSNILLRNDETASGGRTTVKVIDFGIAKAMEPNDRVAAGLTTEAQFLGTPDYMSPEQADGSQGADTRVDIYALGVLLYELLTSTTPLTLASRERSSSSMLLQAIREEEPRRPSVRIASMGRAGEEAAARRSTDLRRLRARLDGDLDWIVLRAIAKDRERRYDSVGSLIADIRRHLAHEPVSAARPGAAYVIGKFVRRHRVGVIGAAAVLGSLTAGLTLTSLALRRAVRAEGDLRLARDQAVAVNDFLVDDLLGSASSNRAGHRVTVVDAMKSALPDVDQRFLREPAVGARVKSAIGSVFRDIGLLEESLPPLRAAVEVLTRELGVRHSDTIQATVALGDALRELGRDEEAEAILRPAATASEAALGPDDPQTLKLKGSLGEILQKRGRHAEAEPLLRDTIFRMRRVMESTSEPLLAATMSLVACLGAQQRDEEALPHSRDVLVLTRASFPPSHPAVMAAMNNHAAMLSNLGRHGEAEPIYRELLAAVEASLPAGHWQIAVTRYSLGRAMVKCGRADDALPLLDRAVAEATEALGQEHEFVRRMVAERDLYARQRAEEASRR